MFFREAQFNEAAILRRELADKSSNADQLRIRLAQETYEKNQKEQANWFS